MKLEQVVFRIEMDLRDDSNVVELSVRSSASQGGQRHILHITDDSPPVWRLKMGGGS